MSMNQRMMNNKLEIFMHHNIAAIKFFVYTVKLNQLEEITHRTQDITLAHKAYDINSEARVF